jgi:hypothetical protein
MTYSSQWGTGTRSLNLGAILAAVDGLCNQNYSNKKVSYQYGSAHGPEQALEER